MRIRKSLINDMEKYKCSWVTTTKMYNYSMTQKYPLIMSIPKSGTHLLLKLMRLLVGKDFIWNFSIYTGNKIKDKYTPGETLIFEEKMDEYDDTDFVMVTHSNMVQPYQTYLGKHPEQKTIIITRDLRDVFISTLLDKYNLPIY